MNTVNTKSMTRKNRVCLIDDHAIVREGFSVLVNQEKDLEVICEAANIADAIEAINECRPDLVITDLVLEGGGSGIRLIEDLLHYNPDQMILVLSMHDENMYARRCLKAGAMGYIMKDEPFEEVLKAIKKVLSGAQYISESLQKDYLDKIISNKLNNYSSPLESLSTRETEVYQMFGKGLVKREIADRLHLSTKTIDTYVEHIRKKMKFKSTHELLVHAVRSVNNDIK